MSTVELTVKKTEPRAAVDNLLVRIHLIIEMIWWTGLAPWEFEFTPTTAWHIQGSQGQIESGLDLAVPSSPLNVSS